MLRMVTLTRCRVYHRSSEARRMKPSGCDRARARRRPMKRRILQVLVSAFVLVAVAGVSYTAGAMQSGKAVMTPIGSVKWEPYAPGNPLQVGVLWGDRTKGGEYGMLLKIPAGFDSGPHSHT